jgi:hypothetical protein
MARHFRILTTLVSALTLSTLSLHAADPSAAPSVAQAGIAALRNKPGKIGKLDTSLGNGTLRMVTSNARRTTQCIGADLGHFAILTSYDCLADWWKDKAGVSVLYSTYGYMTFSGNFVRAFRGRLESGDSWAVLETDSHTGGSFGYYDLDSDIALDRKVFQFVGLSSKVKNGKEPAMQSGCHLLRDGPGTYASDCGADFSATGFLIVQPADPGRQGTTSAAWPG